MIKKKKLARSHVFAEIFEYGKLVRCGRYREADSIKMSMLNSNSELCCLKLYNFQWF